MPSANPKSTAASKMTRYRARLRAAGLRPVQIWLPDPNSRQLADEIRRQSKIVSRRKSEREAIALIEEIAEADGTW